MQVNKFISRIKNSFPLQIKVKKYKKHFVVRFAIYQDPLWPALTIGIITALFLIFFPFNRQAQHTVTASHDTATLAKELTNDYIPREIFIPIFELSLPIKPAAVSANEWDLYDDHVSWFINSGDISEGNIVLYAHNRKNLFGPITQLEEGRLIILSSNNLQQRYEVIQAFEASPTDVHLIQNQDENLLTIYTCSGWFDSKRFFVIAEPVEN